jgi:hypothetical protein
MPNRNNLVTATAPKCNFGARTNGVLTFWATPAMPNPPNVAALALAFLVYNYNNDLVLQRAVLRVSY